MIKIRKNDTVQVIKGKDNGKKGRVLQVYTGAGRILVEGVNLVKKHKKQTRQDQTGGIISIERPMAVGNVMLVCKSCNRPVRVGFSIQADTTKARICKKCREVI